MENNSQAIEIKGITRNLTKLGVQDGQCEDIVNLRFKDGSWRVSDDGKVVYTMTGTKYQSMYVHTNSTYRHLLGVNPTDNMIYWFANIDSDGNITNCDPIQVAQTSGDVMIEQTGHLITIVSGNKISYAIFVTGDGAYRIINVDANGNNTDRGVYPFGRVHLNLDSDYSTDKEYLVEDASGVNGYIRLDYTDINYNESGACVPEKDNENSERTLTAKQIWHSQMLEAFNKAKEDNSFSKPFLAMVAVKLYDGSYLYSSNPVLLNPREKYNRYQTAINNDVDMEGGDTTFFQRQGALIGTSTEEWYPSGDSSTKYTSYKVNISELCHKDGNTYTAKRFPNFLNGISASRYRNDDGTMMMSGNATETPLTSVVLGSDICITLGDLSFILDNPDVFTGISIFVTNEADLYKSAADDYKEGKFYIHSGNNKGSGYKDGAKVGVTVYGNITYKPAIREANEIINDLINSPFYLLREYSVNELKTMSNTSTIVDLSDVKYKWVLKNIVQQDRLPNGALERKSFKPKFAYNYNQRLHIANYETEQFNGYPIDFFQLSNHNVKYQQRSYAVGGVLPNLVEGAEYQYPREKHYFAQNDYANANTDVVSQYINRAKSYGTCFAAVSVTIDTQQGEQQVVRYITPYNANSVGEALGEPCFAYGDYANFVEDLSPLICFPDSRAKKMSVKIISLISSTEVDVRESSFNLTPHPYLNIAYYLSANLKPISISGQMQPRVIPFGSADLEVYAKPYTSKNTTENFSNGVKVSMTSNRFTFPYESTYQIGSSEIVALMSNAVAVGVGQTGAAPLYVFCKDGVYALLVDSSGEMAYTNARIIARDVCNNAKSVTPIDGGVVFTTDRGLMSIAGNEVVEIGQVAEGDLFDITDTSDKAKKIMFNAFTMPQLSEFPQSLIDNTDFLTYLKGAIVNYNHNERELMVSNPSKDYTYVMDRNGNWSRRAFTAQEYVNNYPTSYRIDKAGNFYKVDADDNDTNKVYLLSNVIKLGTIAFKQAYRLVVRGYFETVAAKLGLYVFGSYDGRQWAMIGANERDGQFTDIGCKISHTDIRFLRVCLAGKLSKDTRIDYIEVSADGSALNGKLR